MNKTIKLSAFVSVFFFFISISAIAGTVQYTYDSLNRIIKIERDNEAVIEYTYNASGNRDIDGTDLSSFVIGYINGDPFVADLDVDIDDLKIFALNFGK
jgi:hypothetical protein